MDSPAATRSRERVERDLPLTVDLLAACSGAGLPVDRSLVLVSQSIGGPLAARLDDLGTRLRLGGDPVAEWGRLTHDPALASLARTMVRTLESGAPLVESLHRLSVDRRRERRAVTQARARSVGVKAAGPLAACFLPAFMLIGVVPTIAGSFSHLAF